MAVGRAAVEGFCWPMLSVASQLKVLSPEPVLGIRSSEATAALSARALVRAADRQRRMFRNPMSAFVVVYHVGTRQLQSATPYQYRASALRA